MIFYQLARPFAFASIKAREIVIARRTIPLVATAVVAAVYFFLPVKPDLTGEKQYLDYLLQIIGILPGFYVAALAAAATFPGDHLDDVLPGKTPATLSYKKAGESFEQPMTMRVFVCHLFAYLSAVSFMTSLLALAATMIAPSYRHLLKLPAFEAGFGLLVAQTAKFVIVGIITFYFIQVIVVTMFGLYFLIERMHQENR